MPTRSDTINLAAEAFENSIYPDGLSSQTAWLGFYQTLLWYQPVNHWGFDALPHIIDADKFRLPKKRTVEKEGKPPQWIIRAAAVHQYLATELRCELNEVALHFDRLMSSSSFEGLQRQNTLGIAFAGLVKYALEKFSHSEAKFETEKLAKIVFPGLPLSGRSQNPAIDVFATKNDVPIAIISTKWSLRHDRLNDLTSEAPEYKAAFNRIYRQRGRADLKCFVVTNEFDPARLSKLIDDSGIDSVVHVRKRAIIEICKMNGRLSELVDLGDFLEQFSNI
jgi:hypothetical protein